MIGRNPAKVKVWLSANASGYRRIRITSESGLETPHYPLEWDEYITDIRETWRHLRGAGVAAAACSTCTSATAVPRDLDVTASRTGKRVFLHEVNTSRTRDIPAVVAVDGMKVRPGKAYQKGLRRGLLVGRRAELG